MLNKNDPSRTGLEEPDTTTDGGDAPPEFGLPGRQRSRTYSNWSLSPGARRNVLVLGESLLLWIVCVPIVGYEDFVKLVTGVGYRDLGDLPWKWLLLRSILIPLACQISYAFQDLYDWRVTSNRNLTSVRLLQAIFYAGVLLAAAYYAMIRAATVLEAPDLLRYVCDPWTTVAVLVALFPVSYLYRVFFHWVFSQWSLSDRMLLLGNGTMARVLEQELRSLSDPGYEVVGVVARDESGERLESADLGPGERLCEIALQHRVNVVAVTLDERRGRLPTLELLNCRLAGIRVEEGEQIYERLTGKLAVQRLRPSYLIFSEGFQTSKTTFAIKRLMDLALAVVGLVLLSPLCAAVAVAIKLDSRGPVFYGQHRVGKDGRLFTTLKFRTMHSDAEAGTGPQWAAKNDARVTRVGGFLRRTRIDEIPQMWNVLRNEMSFVGPRPERPFFVEELRKQIPYYMERLLVKPGITGWAQINYQYGSSIEDALTKLQYDLYYIKNLSIFLDAVTLLRTVKVVVLRRGAV